MLRAWPIFLSFFAHAATSPFPVNPGSGISYAIAVDAPYSLTLANPHGRIYLDPSESDNVIDIRLVNYGNSSPALLWATQHAGRVRLVVAFPAKQTQANSVALNLDPRAPLSLPAYLDVTERPYFLGPPDQAEGASILTVRAPNELLRHLLIATESASVAIRGFKTMPKRHSDRVLMIGPNASDIDVSQFAHNQLVAARNSWRGCGLLLTYF